MLFFLLAPLADELPGPGDLCRPRPDEVPAPAEDDPPVPSREYTLRPAAGSLERWLDLNG